MELDGFKRDNVCSLLTMIITKLADDEISACS